MIRLLMFACFAVGSFFSVDNLMATQKVYVSAGGKITVYTLNEKTGELSAFQEVALQGAGPLGTSRSQKLLYASAAVMTGTPPKRTAAIATFKIGPDGTLTQANIAPVNNGAGYLRTDANDNFLAGNHYGPGMATIWKLVDGIYKGETVQEIKLEKNAHSAVFSPDNKHLLVPATGPNKVFQNKFDPATGKTTPNNPPFASGPQGEKEAQQPRHLIFHPNGKIVYTTLERLQPGVGVWSYNTEQGTLQVIQNLVTLDKGASGAISTADLHLTPDSKFLYVSVRDTNKRDANAKYFDSIAGFAVNGETGKLTFLGYTACPRVPRSFKIDETGKFMFVAGQGDAKLSVFSINPENGALKQLHQYDVGTRPAWVHCMTPPTP